ncbi:MAG: tRNA (adenosine(37)-N6)-threonylcarbamoyltransferase complex dimerization subunit type 1 TsaB [Gammaproteobacteria bacterium]
MTTRILAIETSSAACSAALSVDGEVVERDALAPRQHAALILPMIESLLAESGCAVGELDAIAFGRGPGSFTGVRIAASIVQGIAFAADLPVIPVSTLAALAFGAMRESSVPRVIAALDARREEVYWACYERTADGVLLLGDEHVCTPDAAPSLPAGDWVAAGSGWEAYAEILMPRFGEQLVRVLPDLEPRAGDVVRIAIGEYRRGSLVKPEDAVPVYLRDNVADVKRP